MIIKFIVLKSFISYIILQCSMVTTIQIDEKIKEKLENLKVHYRETYNDIISRLINFSPNEVDRESLTETIEILSDPEMMREIAKGLEDYEKGKTKTFKQIRKELGFN